MRTIINLDYQAHSTPLFSKLGILDIFHVNTFEITKFMFCYKNNLFPPLLLNLLVTNSQIYCYGTTTASNYCTHLSCKNLKQFTVFHLGPKIWNSLSVSVTHLSNLFSSEMKMKEFFTSKHLFHISLLTINKL